MFHGRFWALKNNSCPRDEFDKACPDCPNSCPLYIKDEIIEKTTYGKSGVEFKHKYLTGRNNPVRHPEDFIDEYMCLYPDDEYELDYSVDGNPIINGEKTYGYYLKKEPEHWEEFLNNIQIIIKMRI